MNTTHTTFAVSVLGLIGVASMIPALPGFIRRVVPPARAARGSMARLVALATVQSTLLVVLCAWAGAHFSSPLGLVSGLPGGQPPGASGASGAFPGAAVVAAIVIGAIGSFVVARWAAPLATYVSDVPILTRVLYGGLTEEVLVRWALLGSVAWCVARAASAASRTLRTETSGSMLSGSAVSGPGAAWVAILVTTAVFATAHLPVLRAASVKSRRNVVLVIFLVSLPWGWLAWRCGLIAACVAHMTFHVVLAGVARRRSD